MSWLEHHAVSEQHAAAAEAAARRGDYPLAQQLYAQAAAAEELALAEAERQQSDKARTWGITAVSAAVLYHKAGRDDAAGAIARRSLASDDLPAFARRQLADLLDTIAIAIPIANAAAPGMTAMGKLSVPDHTLFEGDNRPILRDISSESIDAIAGAPAQPADAG